MTWREIAACIEGWNRVHGGEQPVPPMTGEEFDELRAKFRDH